MSAYQSRFSATSKPVFRQGERVEALPVSSSKDTAPRNSETDTEYSPPAKLHKCKKRILKEVVLIPRFQHRHLNLSIWWSRIRRKSTLQQRRRWTPGATDPRKRIVSHGSLSTNKTIVPETQSNTPAPLRPSGPVHQNTTAGWIRIYNKTHYRCASTESDALIHRWHTSKIAQTTRSWTEERGSGWTFGRLDWSEKTSDQPLDQYQISCIRDT